MGLGGEKHRFPFRLRRPQEGLQVLPGEEAGLGPGEDALFPKPPVEGGPGGEGLEDPHHKGPARTEDAPGLEEDPLHVLHELQGGEEEDHVKAFPGEGQGLAPSPHPGGLGRPPPPHGEHGLGRLHPHLLGIGKAPKPVPGPRAHLEEAFPGGRSPFRALSSSAMT